MNKLIENAMKTRETAMTSSFIRGLDLAVGDYVQIRPGRHHAGKIGIIIGISFYKKKGDLRYNVMFSDHEAALFTGERLKLVKQARDKDR